VVPIAARGARARSDVDAAEYLQWNAPAPPQILITIAAALPGFMEIQLNRIRAYFEGRRRIDPNVLHDGD